MPAAAPRTSLHIRNLDPRLKRALCLSAVSSGVSMEEEARRILASALAEFIGAEPPLPASLGAAMTMLFGTDAGAELGMPPREMGRTPPDLGEVPMDQVARSAAGRLTLSVTASNAAGRKERRTGQPRAIRRRRRVAAP